MTVHLLQADSCYTGSVLLLLRAKRVVEGFFSFLLATTRSCTFPGQWRCGSKSTAWHCGGMFGDWVLSNTLIGLCGRLSGHESSLSLYGPTLRLELPDGDSLHSYWHFDPMHNPEILVHIMYSIAVLWVFSTEHHRISKNSIYCL